MKKLIILIALSFTFVGCSHYSHKKMFKKMGPNHHEQMADAHMGMSKCLKAGTDKKTCHQAFHDKKEAMKKDLCECKKDKKGKKKK